MYDSARWLDFAFRDDDIVVCAPQKCGTTWMQMICALLVFGTDQLPGRLGELSPWLDAKGSPLDAVTATLDAQAHRRFIKTHSPLDALPYRNAVSYLCVAHDPRDVAISSYHNWLNVNHPVARAALAAAERHAGQPETTLPPPFQFRDVDHFFDIWVGSPPPRGNPTGSLAGLTNHFRASWERRNTPNVTLLHYQHLETGLASEMRCIADVLGIQVAHETWPTLLRAATFDAMRARADDLVPEVHITSFWNDNTAFFRRGTSGQWRDVLSPNRQQTYLARLDELDIEPALRAWIHGEAPAV